MSVCVVVGAQWGDEGKGKITHLLAADYQVDVRYQGGTNAGHSVRVGEEDFKFHLLPSAILREGKLCIIANGVVVDPIGLAREVEELRERGWLRAELVVASGAHLVMPYHKLLDRLEERLRGKDSIGTTGHGIGPAYSDKYNRSGLNVAHLLEPAVFRRRLEFNLKRINALLAHLYGEPELDADEIYDQVMQAAESFLDLIRPVPPLMRRLLAEDREILLEGAQGTLLDIDYGTYPFVTSSHPVAGGACLGTGIAPTRIDRVIGVSKAYATRVGNGSFPTEQFGEVGEIMRRAGNEYGTTTGRPRRCGWLDLVLLKYAAFINGCTELAITKLDVLDEFEEIKVCTAYRYEGEVVDEVDPDDTVLARCEPIYETLPGWNCDTTGITERGALPPEVLGFISFIEEQVGLPVTLLSVGPACEQSVFLSA